jgi:general secretion pathway protein M
LPTGRKGQALAVVIAVASISLFWLGITAPLMTWYADRAGALASLQQRAAHMRAAVATIPALRQVVAAKPSGDTPEVLLSGSNDALAAAALQEHVQRLANAAGAALSSAEVLVPTKTGHYRQIGLRISIQAPYSSLIRLLTMFEQGPPRMFVDDLTIQSPTYDLNLPMLEVTRSESLVVYAFRDGLPAEEPARGAR